MGGHHLHRAGVSSWSCQVPARLWSSSALRLSGHNRWSKIKHDKGKADAAKSKAKTMLSHAVITASRLGGPDPAFNSRLAFAIANAKRGQLTKSAIEHAIAKGQGKSPTGQALESVIIEAILPHGVAAMIECETDNKNRTLSDLRHVIKVGGGTVTPTAFLFEKKGRIVFEEQDKLGVDDVLEKAIDAGALDISSEDKKLTVETEPADVMDVARSLQDQFGLQAEKAEVVYIPNEDTVVPLTPEQQEELERILDSIEEDPTVQGLYVNAVSK
ncbi:transcriptional regulatory protein [Exophiala dermatitidis]